MNGCGAISGLSIDRDNLVKLGTIGVSDAVTAAMKANPSHAGVVKEGCRAIILLSLTDCANSGAVGTCEAVSEALKAHLNCTINNCSISTPLYSQS